MVTRSDLLKAIRAGEFVPFLDRKTKLDINTQMHEFTSYLFCQDIIDTFKYIHKVSDRLPNTLTPKERLFARSLRRGLIQI